MAYITILFYIIFGLFPSLIWLFFYLKKDAHPEPKGMIIKIFLFGMIAAAAAAAIEIIFSKLLFSSAPLSVYNFLFIALVEELSKFLVIKFKVMKSSELDEPVDIMLYMIIAALGFAALENLLYIFPIFGVKMSIFEAGAISLFRFLGATFLHALCSATIGFFLAYAIFKQKYKHLLILLGFFTAVFLHGIFNLLIINFESGFLVALLVSLGLEISFAFKKLKKIASVCKIK